MSHFLDKDNWVYYKSVIAPGAFISHLISNHYDESYHFTYSMDYEIEAQKANYLISHLK